MTSDNDIYMASITKQELSQLPCEEFKGAVKVIDSIDDISSAIKTLSESDIIGFDTETRPSFKRGQLHNVSLLQLSTRKECFLFRLNKIGFPDQLKSILENPDILKIGLSIHDDFHKLNRLRPTRPESFIDLQNYVKKFRIADNSLTKIYAIVFGKRISKGQRLTNWEADKLSANQQAYAALDAVACIDIYEYLQTGGFDPTKSPYYREIALNYDKEENNG